MNIFNISVSHKTASVEIREQLAFSMDEKLEFIKSATMEPEIEECVLITTCNRTEVYIFGEENSSEIIMDKLAKAKGFILSKILKHILRFEKENAVKHLFGVACGLDSMLIGEDEILGQVKEDYQIAFEHGTTGYILNTLFREAITCAKKVKTDTKLSKTPVSIGTLTANEVFHTKVDAKIKKVLIIGLTGKFGTIVMKNLYHNQNIEVTGTIRTHSLLNDELLFYPKVKLVDYQDRYENMNDADIIISATKSPHYTITYDELKTKLTNQKKRLFIDLAVPMDIDKEITKLEDITLIDIDYFKKLSENNNQIKMLEVEAAKVIIESQVDEFLKEIKFRNFLPQMEALKNVVANKTLEGVLYQLKNSVNNAELEVILNSLKKLIS